MLIDKGAVNGVIQGECYISKPLVPKVYRDIKNLTDVTTSSKLTEREYELLRLIAQGDDDKTIARRLFISEKTVKNHLTNIYSKLGVTNQTQAATYAINMALLRQAVVNDGLSYFLGSSPVGGSG